jgi:hypothetical protein
MGPPWAVARWVIAALWLERFAVARVQLANLQRCKGEEGRYAHN